MKKNKITKQKILSLIKEEAEVNKRKREIYNEVLKFNKELKSLYENKGLAGTFGFTGPSDNLNKTSVTGFKNPQNISYVSYLEKEFAKEDAKKAQSNLSKDELNEMIQLKKENNSLKERLNKFEEALKTLSTNEKTK